MIKERRKRGEGSIYKKHDKYYASYRKTIHGEEKTRKIEASFNTRKEAEKWLVENQHVYENWLRLERGEVSAEQIEGTELTFEQTLARYKEGDSYKNLTNKTKQQYEHYYSVARAKTVLMRTKICALTQKEFADAIKACGSSHDVQKRAKNAFSSVVSFAVSRGWMQSNCIHGFKLPALVQKKKDIISVEDEEKLWSFYNGNIDLTEAKEKMNIRTDDDMFRLTCAFYLIMIHCGARPNEIYNAKPSNVNLDKMRIYDSGSKTEMGRSNPIIITARIAGLVRDNMTPKNRFSEKNIETFRICADKLFKLLGIDRIMPSACRTTCATRLRNSGVRAEDAMIILRHKSYNTSVRYYQNVSDESAHDELERVDRENDMNKEDDLDDIERQISELIQKKEEMIAKLLGRRSTQKERENMVISGLKMNSSSRYAPFSMSFAVNMPISLAK